MARVHTKRRMHLGRWAAGGLVCGVVVAWLPVGPPAEERSVASVPSLDLAAFSPDRIARPLRLLFIHHSCGGQWLAPVGADRGNQCIDQSAVNGGGLRDRLRAEGYDVHEASYGSAIGDQTDIFDWPGKFRNQMEKILRCDQQDACYEDLWRNDIVMFKPCFPNNLFVGRGIPPGNPQGPELTVANAQAAYRALLPEFERHPETLFVAVTAPPLARGRQPWFKVLARGLLRRPDVDASGRFAREFNNWLKDPQRGWLNAYPAKNVIVFDLYDLLTDGGQSDFPRYGSGPAGDDSHPSAEGNQQATASFVPLLNRAVRRAGLSE